MRTLLNTLVLVCAVGAAQAETARVTVEGAWARATVPGQQATGAFMKLTAREPLHLVSAATPVAGVSEVHEMKMEDGVMKMRAMDALELPAGQTVELKPGGYHVMLMQLKQPLKPGSQVPLTLTFRNAKGKTSTLAVDVPVSAAVPAGEMGMHKR
jgi:copper(I)-binding protein